MIGIPIGLAYTNASEWLIHKYVLHGWGKKRSSFWSFHFHEHHRAARTHEMKDADYLRPPLKWNAQGKEAVALSLLTATHLPLFFVAPFFTGTLVYGAVNYYRKHKQSHLDPDWARTHLPWHYDHHMGPDQDCNWCVTKPWFDHIMGTRVPYVGTPQEAMDIKRRAKRAERRKTVAEAAKTVAAA
jgi:sterol desaturase/sphingolipid hydroxylase (fatty acid hydroxylase superfamily)